MSDQVGVRVICDLCNGDATLSAGDVWVIALAPSVPQGFVAEALYTCPHCSEIGRSRVRDFDQQADLVNGGARFSPVDLHVRQHPAGGAP